MQGPQAPFCPQLAPSWMTQYFPRGSLSSFGLNHSFSLGGETFLRPTSDPTRLRFLVFLMKWPFGDSWLLTPAPSACGSGSSEAALPGKRPQHCPPDCYASSTGVLSSLTSHPTSTDLSSLHAVRHCWTDHLRARSHIRTFQAE